MEAVPAQIRPATAIDLVAVLRLDPLAVAGDRQRAEFLSRCTAVGECHVYIADGNMAGFVVRRQAHFFGRDFIELLVVDAGHRRSGIGRALLRHALDTAFTAQVFTSTNVSNTAMRSLLRAEDWTFSGQLDGLDPDDPELFFCKTRGAPVS